MIEKSCWTKSKCIGFQFQLRNLYAAEEIAVQIFKNILGARGDWKLRVGSLPCLQCKTKTTWSKGQYFGYMISIQIKIKLATHISVDKNEKKYLSISTFQKLVEPISIIQWLEQIGHFQPHATEGWVVRQVYPMGWTKWRPTNRHILFTTVGIHYSRFTTIVIGHGQYHNSKHYDFKMSKGFDYLFRKVMDREDYWLSRKFLFL